MVSQWYLQAYSLTKFLMKRFSPGQFIEFCRLLAAGEDVEHALQQGYGLQLMHLADLERLWRQDLEQRISESKN